MRAVWLVLTAGFRRQWRSWVLLGLVIAVASGFVLASTAAGRRTDSAFPRYVASHGYDAVVYAFQPLPQLRQLPEVAQVTPVRMPFSVQPLCSCHRKISYGSFSVREVPPGSLGRVAKLVAGRLPDPSSPVEALASFTLQRDYGVHLGTVITLPLAAASQRQAVVSATADGPRPQPAGPRMAMRVVGIAAAENEFSYGQGATYTLYPGPGFGVATKDVLAFTSYYVRLRHGQVDFARFEARTSRLDGINVQDLDRPAALLPASARVPAWALIDAAYLAGFAVATLTARLAQAPALVVTDSLTERFGAFIIIVLGETLTGVVTGLAGQPVSALTLAVGLVAVVVGFGAWWTYFDYAGHRNPRPGAAVSLQWILGHLPLTAAIAAMGAAMVGLVEHAHDGRTPAAAAWILCAGAAVVLGVTMLIAATLQAWRRDPGLYRPLARTCAAVAVACLALGAARPAPLILGLALVLLLSIPWGLAVTRRLASGADSPAKAER